MFNKVRNFLRSTITNGNISHVIESACEAYERIFPTLSHKVRAYSSFDPYSNKVDLWVGKSTTDRFHYLPWQVKCSMSVGRHNSGLILAFHDTTVKDGKPGAGRVGGRTSFLAVGLGGIFHKLWWNVPLRNRVKCGFRTDNHGKVPCKIPDSYKLAWKHTSEPWGIQE